MLVLAMMWWLRQRRLTAPFPQLPVVAAERSGERLAHAAAAAGERTVATPTPTPTVTGGDAISEPPPPSSEQSVAGLASTTAAEYRHRARFPRWSQPIEEGGEDPIVRDRQVSANSFRGADGAEPALTVFPERVSFEDPDDVVLYAYLSEEDAIIPARLIEAEIVDGQGQAVARVLYRDDGQGADARAADGVYTAELAASTVAATGLDGAVLVRVRAVADNGAERRGSTGFLYSRPAARLTGHYADRVVDGSLQIAAQVEVRRAARLHIEATLYSQSGRPLAWAQHAAEVTPGEHALPLSFYGLVLREKGEDGPYVLKYVALSTAGRMPNAKSRLVEDVHVTQAYPLTVFTDRPFGDPGLLDAAARLERAAEARRGER
jgi:hypothetical protein